MSDYSSMGNYGFGGRKMDVASMVGGTSAYNPLELPSMSLVPQPSANLLAPNVGTFSGASAPSGWLESFSNWGAGVNDALRKSGVLGSIDAKTGMRQDGWGGLALGTVSALGNAYMGMKQYKMAEDQFKFKKGAWQQEFDMQKQTLNEARFDREQRRRRERGDIYGNPYGSMAEWGAAGKSLG